MATQRKKTSRHDFSRRDFLGTTSSLATLGFVCGHSEVTANAITAKPLGIAVVGLGQAGLGFAVPALANTQRCRLAACVSQSIEKAKVVAVQNGLSPNAAYRNEEFDCIASDPTIDAVYLAQPNAQHGDFAIRAAQAGKHVLVESPMACDSQQATAMHDACRKAGTQLAMIDRTATRFGFPNWASLQQSVTLEPLQKIELVLADALRSAQDWRRSATNGGGALLGLGADAVRICRALVGNGQAIITAQKTKRNPHLFQDVDESITWTMAFACGAVAHGAVTYNPIPTGTNATCRGIQSKLRCLDDVSVDASVLYQTNATQDNLSLQIATTATALDAFAQRIFGQGSRDSVHTNIRNAEDAITELQLLDAIRIASENGSAVAWNPLS